MTSLFSKSTLVSFLGASFALALGACSYNPSLPNDPFKCGTTAPKCPDGFTCNTANVCVGGPDAGSSHDAPGNFICDTADSVQEPNDTINSATQTPVASQRASVTYSDLAICPSTDIDDYEFVIDVDGQDAVVTITYQANGGKLNMSVLSSNNVVVAQGQDAGSNMVRATLNHLAVGDYFVSVSAAPGGENNYSLQIAVTGP